MKRRGVLAAMAAFLLSGCDRLSRSPSFREFLLSAEGLNRRAQRMLHLGGGLAREFDRADISPVFRANGKTRIDDAAYRSQLDQGFVDWRLVVDGLVERPLALSLDEIRALPARTQITRHDCVEGWSSIAEWTGARLSALLERAGLKSNARYIVFHCADRWAGGEAYYESIDLYDAHHPQTILAYAMNGATLPEPHGAPLRLRVERQLGYKHAKYVMRIEATDSLANIGGGRGGFWEDQGYEWYAGI
jgi:DMSO/TMAO reductase YedYZ molybdopterin-dependent catalytic subunit